MAVGSSMLATIRIAPPQWARGRGMHRHVFKVCFRCCQAGRFASPQAHFM
jgi:hypothetical protein